MAWYIDKQIIKERREAMKSSFTNLATEIYAGSQLIRFEDVCLFPGERGMKEIHISLPQEFAVMEGEKAKRKYPSQNRPQVIFTDESGKINFTFSLFLQQASQDQIKGTLARYQALIRKLRQDADTLDAGIYQMTKACGGWFTFQNCTVDDEVFNLLAIIGLPKRLVLCMCNCPLGEKENWEAVMQRVVQAICEEG